MRTRFQDRRFFRALMLALGVAVGGVLAGGAAPALAQAGAPNFFSYVEAPLATMSQEQRDRLATYQADPTNAEMSIVRISPDLLRAADAVTLNLQGHAPVVLNNIRFEERGPSDFSWFGSPGPGSVGPLTEVIIVVKGSDVVGTIRVGDELFRLRPAGADQVLIRVDQSAFPEEHPPAFEELERQSRSMAPMVSPAEAADICAEYTALVAYTPAAKAEAGNVDALIQLAIDETNQGYANAGVGTKIKLVYKYQTTYTESADMALDRDRFRTSGDGIMDEVHGLRDANAADVAILITKSGNYCGIAAAIGADAATAFAVVGQNCATGYYSFAHEIGHLQGARHNPEADPGTPFAYGHGYYYLTGHWRTIMSYDCPGGCTRLNYWSNPNVNYGGIAMGTVATNHNARVLNETSCKVAGFRGAPPAASGPLAFGVLWSDGVKQSGTPNWSSSYNSTYKRYEITITGENYYYTKYATTITPAGDVRFCRSDSVSGKLLLYCYDHTGAAATSRIGFVTYKK